MTTEPDLTPAGLFRLSGRQTAFVGVLVAAAFAAAYFLRYRGIENSRVALACQAGAAGTFCATLTFLPSLFRHSVFGWTALAAAALNLIHPSIFLFTLALVVAAFGLVLYNAGLCGLAVALVILSFARRAPETI